jgi:hypothetical protein
MLESNFVTQKCGSSYFQTCLSNLRVEVLPSGKQLFEVINRKLSPPKADVYVAAGEKFMPLLRVEASA